jgi:PKD repeat protein
MSQASFSVVNIGGGRANFINTSTGMGSGATYRWTMYSWNMSQIVNWLQATTPDLMNSDYDLSPYMNYVLKLTVTPSLGDPFHPFERSVCSRIFSNSDGLGIVQKSTDAFFSFSGAEVTYSCTDSSSSTSTAPMTPILGRDWVGFQDGEPRTNDPTPTGTIGNYFTSITENLYDNETTHTGATFLGSYSVTIPGIVTYFDHTPDPQDPGFNVLFQSGSLDYNYSVFDWDFGDGSTSTGMGPTHSYAAIGTYTVTLNVSMYEGVFVGSPLTHIITIANLPPVAGFYYTTEPQQAPGVVTFIDTSTAPNVLPTSWLWDFGDGNTSTDQNPVHYYNDGTYAVQLTVTNPGGSDSTTQNVVIQRIDFTHTPDPQAPGVDVTFTDISTVSHSNWYWDFGDGNTSNIQNPTHAYNAERTFTVTLSLGEAGSITHDINITRVDPTSLESDPTVVIDPFHQLYLSQYLPASFSTEK